MNLKTLFATSFMVLSLSACGEKREILPEEQAKIDAAIVEIKNEERVKDFYYEEMWAAGYEAQWNVGVIPTKGSEIGYASYICDLLGEHGLDQDKQLVRIVDITKVVREQIPPKAASLKRISCKTYMVLPE